LPQEYFAAPCVTLPCDGEFVRPPISSSRRGRGSRGAARVGVGSRAPSAFRESAVLLVVRCADVLLHGRGRSAGLLRGMLPPVRTRGGRARASIAGRPGPRGASRDPP